MKQVFKDNRLFVFLFLIGWMGLIIISLFTEKGEFLLKVSKYHSNSLNKFFAIATRFAEEIAFIICAVFYLFYRLKYALTIGLTGMVVMIVSFSLKSLFRHERPFIYFQNRGMDDLYAKIEGVDPYLGLTSFPSGHTMAAFALMFLLSIYANNKIVDAMLFIIACMVGFSRIYLGHHFIEDVILGSIVGLLIAALMYYLMEKWKLKSLDKSIITVWRKEN